MELRDLPVEVAAQTPSPSLSSGTGSGTSPGTPVASAAPAAVPSSATGLDGTTPFVLDLNMVKSLMAAVNEQLGVDLGDAKMDESAVVAESPELQQSIRQAGDLPPQQSRDSPQKGEYSHVRLICDACGHIVAAVATAVLKAIIEAREEAARVGASPTRMVAPLRKKRGGILGFKELAAKANLSPWHFHRVFRSVTGVTPKAYGEALWDHLMRENGFDVEDSSVVSHGLGGTSSLVNNGSSGGSESGNLLGVASSSAASSDTSNSSPSSMQKPQVGFPVIPSPPVLYNQMDASSSGGANASSSADAQLQRTGSMGAGSDRSGRVRKARSLSRSGRSRSRPRSGAPQRLNTGVAAQIYHQRSHSHARGPRVFGGTVSNMDVPPPRLQTRYPNRHRHHSSISGGEFGPNFLDFGSGPSSALDIPVFDPPDLDSLTLTMPPLPNSLSPHQPNSAGAAGQPSTVLTPPQPNPEPNTSGGAPFTSLNPQWLATPSQAPVRQQETNMVAPSMSFNNGISFSSSAPSNAGPLSGMLAHEESEPMATPPPADALGSLPQQFYMSNKEKIDFENDFGPTSDNTRQASDVFNLNSFDQDQHLLLADPVNNGGNETLW